MVRSTDVQTQGNLWRTKLGDHGSFWFLCFGVFLLVVLLSLIRKESERAREREREREKRNTELRTREQKNREEERRQDRRGKERERRRAEDHNKKKDSQTNQTPKHYMRTKKTCQNANYK